MDVYEKLKNSKKFNASIVEEFIDIYGDKFINTLDFLQKEGRKIYKNIFFPSELIIWTAEGVENEYLLFPNIFCGCQAFILESIYRKKKFIPCKHLLAQKISLILDQLNIREYKDINFLNWINDL